MKVIGAGLPRTGTSSLKAALERLGYEPCYHMFELMRNPDHVDRWWPIITGESRDWERMFDGYQSAVDFPTSIYWRELADAYPEAKLILTVRDPRRWNASLQNAFGGPGNADTTDVPEPMRPFFDLMVTMGEAAEQRVGLSLKLGQLMDDSYATEVFTRHTARVQEALPADRLLVFELGDGWDPLCDFLGVEAPADEPFPHLNDSATAQRIFQTMAAEETIVSPFDAS